jgi:hypothetical protein
MADWFATFIPDAAEGERSLVLDGDLPKADWFAGIPLSRRFSAEDGEVHTVVPGRPIGLHPEDVAELAARGIHLHFHGSFTHGQWREWIVRTAELAPDHLHLHETVWQEDWVESFSRYDAGWLHVFRSGNGGDLAAVSWDDLNLPARMATLAAAGLPMIQRDNSGSTVAIQSMSRDLGIGLFFDDYDELASRLRDQVGMARLRSNVVRHRPTFTFDAHVDRLVDFFRTAIDAHRGSKRSSPSVASGRAGAGRSIVTPGGDPVAPLASAALRAVDTAAPRDD